MKLSIIIPVYNEEGTILTLLQRVVKVVIPGVEKEIIIIDDGSTDSSVSIIEKLQTKKSAFLLLKHKKNMGKGAAIKTGLAKATGEHVLIQDADLEYNPQDIEKLTKPVQKGLAHVVYGTRINRMPNLSRDEKTPLFLLHYLGNRFLSLVTSVLYLQWITDMETCYKLFPREAMKDIKLQARGFEFEPEITAKLLRKGYKIIEVPISTKPRKYNEGKKLNAFKEGPKALWVLIKHRFTS